MFFCTGVDRKNVLLAREYIHIIYHDYQRTPAL